jgi:2'-5' RNA ligase
MREGERRIPRIRSFVAIDIPGAQREALAAHLAGCRAVAPDYRWVSPANLHLTLRFLGNLPPELFEAVRVALASVRRPPFRMAVGAPGMFGSPARPRVIWLGITEGGESLTSLADAVEGSTRVAGLEPADHPFQAHLTLARAGAGRLPDLPPAPALDAWSVSEFVLYQSRLGRPAPRYIPIERYALG